MNVLKIIPEQHTENVQGDFFFVPIHLFSSSHCTVLLPLKTGASLQICKIVNSLHQENSSLLQCLMLADAELLGRV